MTSRQSRRGQLSGNNKVEFLMDIPSDDQQLEGQPSENQPPEGQPFDVNSQGHSSGLKGAEVQLRKLYAFLMAFLLPFGAFAFFLASSYQRKFVFFFTLIVSAALLAMAKYIVHSYNKEKMDHSKDHHR